MIWVEQNVNLHKSNRRKIKQDMPLKRLGKKIERKQNEMQMGKYRETAERNDTSFR